MLAPAMKKLLLFGLLAAAVAAFFLLGLDERLSLEAFKAQRTALEALYAAHPAEVLGVYFLLYVAVAALNLPGAAVMSLAGGALFGFWTGLAAVSLASSIGATLACALSRFLFRDMVKRRFAEALARIDAGVAREGAFYLFTLRLIPVFPFFVINLVMGLAAMPLRTFYWVSLVGMLPGATIFVNAGRELGRIESASGIFSPSLLASFAALGLFPLVAKKVLAWRQARKPRS